MSRRIAAFAAAAACLLAFVAAPVQAAPPAGGQTAEARVSVEGMDDIIRLLNSHGGNRNAATASLVLNLFKGLGKPDAKGKLDYRIAVSPDGKTLVNGVDVAPLIEGATKMGKMGR